MTQTTLRSLVRDAVAEAPRHLEAIYGIVMRARPGTARETIRARIYEQVQDGRILRIAEGVYVAACGAARLLIVEDDSWAFLERCEADVFDVVCTDAPYLMGTDAHLTGTSKPTGQGRSYETRDLDEAWLREAWRVLKQDRAWRSMHEPEARGGGALILFGPAETRATWPHIRDIIALAERVGFTYFGRVTWVHTRGMGSDCGAVESSPILVFNKGPRGLLFDTSFTNVIEEPSLRNAANGDEHEAEKPVAVYVALLRAFAKSGMLVLDSFAGRARWARAAVEQLDLSVVLVEKQPRWVERAAGDWPEVAA